MIDLFWQGGNQRQVLLAGVNTAELVVLEKSTSGKWFAVTTLPGLNYPNARRTLDLHKRYVEEHVQQWFKEAQGVVTAIPKSQPNT